MAKFWYAREISRRRDARGAPKISVVSSRNFARACVYFARPTIAIAEIRDYSQSIDFAKIRELYFASINFRDSRKKVNKGVFNFAVLSSR